MSHVQTLWSDFRLFNWLRVQLQPRVLELPNAKVNVADHVPVEEHVNSCQLFSCAMLVWFLSPSHRQL